ncbi:MAG: hypothetical protein WA826_22000, partial [Silvibacterium sp.]
MSKLYARSISVAAALLIPVTSALALSPAAPRPVPPPALALSPAAPRPVPPPALALSPAAPRPVP